MRKELVVAMLGIALVGCAGRDPAPVATVQPQDAYADCTMIQAEIQANNIKVKELADEQGLKVAQNVAAGVVGLAIWPVWFAMDAKGAASKDVAALQARQQYLAVLATERCAARPAVAQPQPAGRHKTARAPTPAPVKPQPPPPQQPMAQSAAPELEPETAPYKDAPH